MSNNFDKKYQLGHGNSRPFYMVDRKTGELIPVYLPADAIAKEARPGVKAGNPLLDEINEEFRRKGIIEKTKRLYEVKKGIKKLYRKLSKNK